MVCVYHKTQNAMFLKLSKQVNTIKLNTTTATATAIATATDITQQQMNTRAFFAWIVLRFIVLLLLLLPVSVITVCFYVYSSSIWFSFSFSPTHFPPNQPTTEKRFLAFSVLMVFVFVFNSNYFHSIRSCFSHFLLTHPTADFMILQYRPTVEWHVFFIRFILNNDINSFGVEIPQTWIIKQNYSFDLGNHLRSSTRLEIIKIRLSAFVKCFAL